MSTSLTFQNRTLVVADAIMQETLDLAARAAQVSASVLLCGESGTGKELIARYLHEKGPRAKGPFVSINCAAIPDGLMEAELFGFERGAFTGAIAQRIGLCCLMKSAKCPSIYKPSSCVRSKKEKWIGSEGARPFR